MFFVLPQAQNKEKILNPHKELHLRPLDHTPMFSISSCTKLKIYQASFLFYNIKNCHQYTCASITTKRSSELWEALLALPSLEPVSVMYCKSLLSWAA